ncbi:MAG: serpin family protein [Planctomycetaceae bacterium]
MSKKVALPVAALVLVILVWQFSTANWNRFRDSGSDDDSSSPSQLVEGDENKSNGDAKPLPTIAIGGPNADTPATAKIREALTKPISVEIKDEPLNQALAKLGKQLGINIVLDNKRILEAGGDPEEVINHSLENISFRSVLEIILRPLNLNWEIEHETLIVTTNEELNRTLRLYVYDVSDLVCHVTKTGQVITDFEPLIHAMENGVSGPWEAVSGEGGSIVPLEAEGIHVLVVYNNQRCQEGVEAFLRALRTMRHGDVDLAEILRKSKPLREFENPTLKTGLSQITPLTGDELQRVETVVPSGNQFGERLYAQLAVSTGGNLFVSPYSISSALTMAYAGAQGETARQMHQVLRLTVPPDEAHALTRLLQRHLSSPRRTPARYKLHVANRLWCDERFKVLDSFASTMRDNYGAGIERINFSNQPAATAAINDWVSAQTNKLIPELVGPHDVGGVVFMITNAICFEAAWKKEFLEEATKPAEFSTGEAKVQVPMMSQTGPFRYAEVEKTQILELNYQDDQLSMLVLLPEKSADGLTKLEQALGQNMLPKWSAGLETHHVNLKLPKFQFRSHFELSDALRSLGMVDAFVFGPADFSAISGNRQLYITKVLHEAFVDVDEKGTKAAAATSVSLGFGGAAGKEPEPVDFIADHPFLFVIRENETGCILFVGRVVNPNSP